MAIKYDFDFVIIGSGFGGSVSAHRLTEKGYKVGVLEMGKRYTPKDFPKSSWDLKRFLWKPSAGLFGIFKMEHFKHVTALAGTGVGGGSLVYANTLLVPPEKVWDEPLWKELHNWKSVMPAFYQTAKQMLGVTPTPYQGTPDKVLKSVASKHGHGDTWYPTDVAVYFGEKGVTKPDPYFNGQGPERTGCTLCGGCMIGCKDGGKNTLDKNYLYFAEKNGAQVHPETMVLDVKPIGDEADGSNGYEIHTMVGLKPNTPEKRVFYARNVIFSAGVMGTIGLMLKLKAKGSLPQLSDCLGKKVRTNSESLIAVRSHDKDINMSDGVAIGSGIYIDEDTHVEAVRYPEGSDALGLYSTLMVNGKPGPLRILLWLGTIVRHPIRWLKIVNPVGYAKKNLILLVMQTKDIHINFSLETSRSWLPPFRKQSKLVSTGDPIPAYIPKANDFAQKIADEINGTPTASVLEVLTGRPTTAHLLGGAVIANSAKEGVIDGQNRVFNYKNLYVCDGSMIAANLGVNPSLTITALTEQAMSHIPAAAS